MPFRSIDDAAKLQRLMAAMLLIEEDLDLPAILGHLLEEARTLAGARYGALGVLNVERDRLAHFYTSGMTPEEERAIGPRPTGLGVLGLLIDNPKPLRVPDITGHPASAGFPAHHPHMTSFLGVPVKVRDDIYGNLYLTDKIGAAEFTFEDEVLIESLALAAGIAIESAHLQHLVQVRALDTERERIARDLHDAVIQRLFAVGLSLQGLSRLAASEGLADRLSKAVTDIDDTIRQIRSTIFELGPSEDERSARVALFTLVRELDSVLGFEAQLRFVGPVDTVVSDRLAEDLCHVAREALTNVARHAEATEAVVTVAVDNGRCTLTVVDDGVGLGRSICADREGGLGLPNLRERAELQGGKLQITDRDGGGTLFEWCVPLGH